MTSQISRQQARDVIREVRNALQQFSLTRPQDPLDDMVKVQAGLEARYQARVRRWEQDRPRREAAEAAMRLAHERRAREDRAGRPARSPVLAALWSDKPERTRVW